jgi:hypothetical protein
LCLSTRGGFSAKAVNPEGAPARGKIRRSHLLKMRQGHNPL